MKDRLIRTQVSITERQYKFLVQESKNTGNSMSSIIRSLIKLEIEKDLEAHECFDCGMDVRCCDCELYWSASHE